MVATDLDGTVVRHDGSMSPRTLRALAAVEEAGLVLVLVTGRPPRWMAPVVEATGHRGVAICANGGIVYDLHTEQVLEQFAIDPAVAHDVVQRLRAAMPTARFAVERAEGFHHESSYAHPWPDPDMRSVETIELVLEAPVAKLLVRDPSSTSDAMLALATEVLGGQVTVTHSNPSDCLLEISAAGVTKATTLARLAAELGIAADEVVAFGDQPNDVAMLHWAGRGYAMGNAHPEVHAAMSLHTASVEDDGVALVLEQLLGDGIIPRWI